MGVLLEMPKLEKQLGRETLLNRNLKRRVSCLNPTVPPALDQKSESVPKKEKTEITRTALNSLPSYVSNLCDAFHLLKSMRYVPLSVLRGIDVTTRHIFFWQASKWRMMPFESVGSSRGEKKKDA